MLPDRSDNRRVSKERADLELDGLLRLTAARNNIELILQGHWIPTTMTVRAIRELVAAGEQRFVWAERVPT